MELHLPSFAKELIEDPSGWHVYPSSKGKDGLVQLSVNCHSFNMNTLHYDEACSWADNIHRQKQREQERMQHNADLESRKLSSQEVEKLIGDHQLIDVEYRSGKPILREHKTKWIASAAKLQTWKRRTAQQITNWK